MYVTAAVLASELGLSAKTIMFHVRKAESEGWNVRRRIGKPAMINYEKFMDYVNGEEVNGNHKEGKIVCDRMSAGGDSFIRNGREHGTGCDQLRAGSVASDLVADSRSVVLQWHQTGRDKSS